MIRSSCCWSVKSIQCMLAERRVASADIRQCVASQGCVEVVGERAIPLRRRCAGVDADQLAQNSELDKISDGNPIRHAVMMLCEFVGETIQSWIGRPGL